MECNPWKNRAELYAKFLSESNKKTVDEFRKYLNKKINRTKNLLSIYDSSTDNAAKHDLAKTYQYVAKSNNYRDDFVAVNTHSGSDLIPTFNNLVMVSELRAFEIQQIDFADRFRTFNTINSTGKIRVDESSSNEVRNFMIRFNFYTRYVQKMKFLCESKLPRHILEKILVQIPLEYSTYYRILGPDRIRALGYGRSELIREGKIILESQVGGNKRNIIMSNFKIGDRFTLLEIKNKLKILYGENNIESSPKAKVLEDYFEVKKTKVKNPEGKFVDGYEILKLRE